MRFSADKARMMGLVHELSSHRTDERLQMIVDEFLQAGPAAAAQAKALIRDIQRLERAGGMEAVTRHTVATITELRASPEGQEGMSALLERRKAAWIVPS
jgi:methylglutaconyl-CoA hydratase